MRPQQIIDLARRLSHNQRQTIILYVATFGGMLLGVLSSIVNTSFLPPAEYGNVRYVQNILVGVTVVLLFGIYWSGCRLLALSTDAERSRQLRGAMTAFLGFCSLVLLLFTLFCAQFVAKTDAERHLFLVSTVVCAQPLLLNYMNIVLQGDNHIGRLAIVRALPAVLYVPIAYLIYRHWGATADRVVLLQWGLATVVMLGVIASTDLTFRNLHPIWKEIVAENKIYGWQLYYGSLVMVATNYIPGVTLSWFHTDNAVVGYYTLAMTITSPLYTLPAIVGTTYFKQFASERRIPRKVFTFTSALTIASCIVFILLIRPVVAYLYPERYSVVGVYASWLAIGLSAQGFGDMINRYLGSHGQGVMIRNASYASGLVKVIGYTAGVFLWGVWGALATSVLSVIVYLLALLLYYRRFVR